MVSARKGSLPNVMRFYNIKYSTKIVMLDAHFNDALHKVNIIIIIVSKNAKTVLL